MDRLAEAIGVLVPGLSWCSFGVRTEPLAASDNLGSLASIFCRAIRAAHGMLFLSTVFSIVGDRALEESGSGDTKFGFWSLEEVELLPF